MIVFLTDALNDLRYHWPLTGFETLVSKFAETDDGKEAVSVHGRGHASTGERTGAGWPVVGGFIDMERTWSS